MPSPKLHITLSLLITGYPEIFFFILAIVKMLQGSWESLEGWLGYVVVPF